MLWSPLSASYALALTLNASAGSTYTSMVNAMNISGKSIDDINAIYNKIASSLADIDDATSMEISNSVWGNEKYIIKNAYKDVVGKSFNADSRNLPSLELPGAINKWVDEKSHGLIKDAVTTPVDIFLCNVLYFKGIWNTKFDKKNNWTGPFNGSTKGNVTYMHRSDYMYNYSTKEFNAVELPFGNTAFNMRIYLPKDGYTLQDVITHYTMHATATAKYQKMRVNIDLPKFSFKKILPLNDAMCRHGFSDIFDPESCNLSKGFENNPCLEGFQQICVVDVDEDGAVLVAASGLVGASDADTDEVLNFKVDRPFIFTVTERSTGVTLFIGTVNNL